MSDYPQGQAPPPAKRQRSQVDNDDDDDEGAGRERRKIEIKFIKDKGRRHITFSKRKAGIMKKAYELSVLTGTQVLLLVVSETGLVYTFTTPKLQPLVTKPEGKNLIQSCLNAADDETLPGGEEGDDDAESGAEDQVDEKVRNSYQQSAPAPVPMDPRGVSVHHIQQMQQQQQQQQQMQQQQQQQPSQHHIPRQSHPVPQPQVQQPYSMGPNHDEYQGYIPQPH